VKSRHRASPPHSSAASSWGHGTAARRVFTHAEARRFYDRIGAKQDSQAFYDRPALEDLLRHVEQH
jgi:hypothetical protein